MNFGGRLLGTCLILLALTGNAASASLDLAYENFYRDGDLGRTRIILKVTNNTPEKVEWVFVECAFLNNENKALDTATLIGRNIAPASHAYVDGWSARFDGIEHATCRISAVR